MVFLQQVLTNGRKPPFKKLDLKFKKNCFEILKMSKNWI
jgi:hypothetical protein